MPDKIRNESSKILTSALGYIVILLTSIGLLYIVGKPAYDYLNEKRAPAPLFIKRLSVDEFNQYIKNNSGIVCEMQINLLEDKGKRIKLCYDKKQNTLIYLKSNTVKNSEN